MRNLLAVGVVVALVAVAIWWLCSAEAFARPPQPEAPPAALPGAAAAAAAPVTEPVPAQTAANAADATAQAERTAAPLVDATRPTHTLRGRAVDAYVMPKRLQDQKALMEFYRTVNDAAAIRRVRVQVGTVNVLAGQTNEVELKLPADW